MNAACLDCHLVTESRGDAGVDIAAHAARTRGPEGPGRAESALVPPKWHAESARSLCYRTPDSRGGDTPASRR
jgi:hypothetical protein